MINLIQNHTLLQTDHYQDILKELLLWDGKYNQDMYQPGIYSLWEYYHIKNAFTAISCNNRSYSFDQGKEKNGVDNHNAYENVANAFIETISTLTRRISSNYKSWEWQHLHKRSYPHFPFSRTSIKRFFFLEYPYGGSKNTIDSCVYYLSDYEKDDFDCKHSSSLKLIIDMGDRKNSRYSLDTGVSENVLSEFYFNMNIHISDRSLLPLRYNNDSSIFSLSPYSLHLVSQKHIYSLMAAQMNQSYTAANSDL